MRALDSAHYALRPFAFIVVLAFSLAACSRATAPVRPNSEPASAVGTQRTAVGAPAVPAVGNGDFFPLEPGNHWSYDHALSVFLDPDDGPPEPVFGLEDTRLRDIVCVEQRGGRSYFVERHLDGSSPAWWLRYRQDAAGLYELDADFTPPTCAEVVERPAREAGAACLSQQAWAAIAAKVADPDRQIAYRAAWERIQARASRIREAAGFGVIEAGGVLSGEITRLQYPLHPGAHWAIREDFPIESRVEGMEGLDLAVGRLPAWRIALESDELLGPEDHAHLWYGRSGYLRFLAHLEAEATDENGRIGVLVVDESEVLIDVALSGGRLATP